MEEEQRKSLRNKTYAKVLLKDTGILGYMRDLSHEGCQLALISEPGLKHGDLLSVEVLPAEEMSIDRFSVTIQVMWTRNDPLYFITGGLITSCGEKKNGERLKQLYRYYA